MRGRSEWLRGVARLLVVSEGTHTKLSLFSVASCIHTYQYHLASCISEVALQHALA